MATTLNDIITPITQGTYFNTIMQEHLQNGVPIASWVSPRNTGLSLSQISAQLFAALRSLLSNAVAGMFLDYGSGTALTLFAKSQYQIDRVPAQFTQGEIVLRSVPTAPVYTFAAGDVTIGTPGPNTALSRLYKNVESGTLAVGICNVAGFGNGLTITRKQVGVNFNISVGGSPPNRALIIGIVPGVSVTVYPATDSRANPITTCTEIANLINGTPGASAIMSATANGTGSFVPGNVSALLDEGTLVMAFSADSPGLAYNIPTGSPLDLKTGYAGVLCENPPWIQGSWITIQGSDEETDTALKIRCASRWGTIGVGGNADAYIFWAFAIPNGYKSSPVSQVAIFSNMLPGVNFGDYASGAVTVVIAGPAGALSPTDVSAVQNNFELPVASLASASIPGLDAFGKKYPINTLVNVVSATNLNVKLIGTVAIKRTSNAAIAAVQQAVIAAITEYQSAVLIGQSLYIPDKIAGVMAQASPFETAIAYVDIPQYDIGAGPVNTVIGTPLIPLRTQYPLLDLSGISYIYVG